MLAAERVSDNAMSFQRLLDLRYEGQEFAIKVPVSADEIAADDLQNIRDRFDQIHDRSFGHAAPDEPLEMVNIRLSARGIRQKLKMPAVASGGGAPKPRTMRKVCLASADRFEDCPVYGRETLAAGAEIEGPADVPPRQHRWRHQAPAIQRVLAQALAQVLPRHVKAGVGVLILDCRPVHLLNRAAEPLLNELVGLDRIKPDFVYDLQQDSLRIGLGWGHRT